jgi:hypothetical protein
MKPIESGVLKFEYRYDYLVAFKDRSKCGNWLGRIFGHCFLYRNITATTSIRIDPSIGGTLIIPYKCNVKEIMADSDLDFTGAAEVTDIIFTKGEGQAFKAVFAVVPEFELPDYKAYKPKNDDKEDAEDAITDYLLENTQLEIPKSMVDYELNFSDDSEESDPRTATEERVKLLLILKKIARAEGVEVDADARGALELVRVDDVGGLVLGLVHGADVGVAFGLVHGVGAALGLVHGAAFGLVRV